MWTPLMGECFPGQGVSEEDPCFGRPAFPSPSTPEQADPSAAVLLGLDLAWLQR